MADLQQADGVFDKPANFAKFSGSLDDNKSNCETAKWCVVVSNTSFRDLLRKPPHEFPWLIQRTRLWISIRSERLREPSFFQAADRANKPAHEPAGVA